MWTSHPNTRNRNKAAVAPRPSVYQISGVDRSIALVGNGEGVGYGEDLGVTVKGGISVGADMSVGAGMEVWVGV